MRVFYNMSNRDALLKTVFDNHTITTETIKTTTYYKILDTRGKNCITFHYYTDTDGIECIGIVGLDRCSLYTGTELLNKIEKFAKKASIKRLHLEDVSRIELCDGIRIKLYYLDILCTGQSWYNKHGYKSEYHRDEIAHNREFINRPMTDVIDNDEDFMMLSNILNPDAEEPDVKGTVQEVFVQLKRYLKNKGDNCSERIATREQSSLGRNATREQSSLDPVVVKNLKFIRDLIKTIGKRYIKYDGELLDKQITARKTKSTLGKRTTRKQSKSKISRRHTIGTKSGTEGALRKRSNKNKKIKTV
jgi:hypothetical protein